MPKAKRALKRHPVAAKRSNKRVKKHRDKLRAAGLKPVQLWVWDKTRPGFAEQIRLECELINASADSKRVLDEIEALTDFESWK
jgi:hypothetical protein